MEKKVAEHIDIRSATIKLLYELADDIDTIVVRSTNATIAGTATSVVGAVVGIPLGIAATVLTGGAAAPLAIAAMAFFGLSGAGGATSIGAKIGQHVHINSKYKEALEAVKRDQEFGQSFFDVCSVAKGSVSAVGFAASGTKMGADIARNVLKTGDAAVDAVNVAGNVIKISARISIAASIILLPIDIYQLVVNVKDIKSDKRHEKAEEIRKWAHMLKEQLKEVEEVMDIN